MSQSRSPPLVAGTLALGLALPGSSHAMKKLFVGNLPYHITSAQVHRPVSRFGTVMSVIVVGTDRDGESWAEATVAFDRPRDADAAGVALDGRATRVSADALEDERTGMRHYPVDVALDRARLSRAAPELELTAVMPAEVFIATRERTVADDIIQPLQRSFDRALRER